MLTDCMNREFCLSASCERADRRWEERKDYGGRELLLCAQIRSDPELYPAKIESGEYTAGDKIPSEIELARQFDVSRLTVNTAVKELANSGIVERVQGKGTFVRFVPGQSFSSPMAFSGGIKIAPFEHSNNKPHRLLEHGVIKADAALCQKLGLTAENPYVYKIVRCVDVSSEVDEVDYSYVPLSVCKDHTFDCEALKTFPARLYLPLFQ